MRNKLVAEAFYLTNNIEKYGSGFIRIRKALQGYPELNLEVKEIGGGVELIFKQAALVVDASKQLTESQAVEGSERSSVEGSVESSVEGSVEILNLIARKPRITARELAQVLGVSLRAIEKQLAKLKREGRLFRVGPNKGGHWQIQKAVN